MANFGFLRRIGQFINRMANRILGRADVAVQSERMVGLATAEHLTPLAVELAEGTTTLPVWQAGMRQNIKNLYIDQYTLGRGGKAMMTQQDYGRLGAMLKDQYKYLDRYAGDLSGMDVAEREAYIRNRSQLYANASNEAFERGRSAAAQSLGFDEVNWNRTPAESCQTCIDREAMGLQPVGPRGGFPAPEGEAWPADGSTICKCITSPKSKVLVRDRGWLSLLDVRVGDNVWTHRKRWRPVVAAIVKPSFPGESEIELIHSSGMVVSSTSQHRWWTKQGWIAASGLLDIDNSMISYPTFEVAKYEGLLMRAEDEVILPVRFMHVVQGGVSLWEAQRLAGASAVRTSKSRREAAYSRLIEAQKDPGPQILFGGVLPNGTPVYDLTVEEDHSFCIAGFWAHNTNCKCYLSYSNSETGQEWEA